MSEACCRKLILAISFVKHITLFVDASSPSPPKAAVLDLLTFGSRT